MRRTILSCGFMLLAAGGAWRSHTMPADREAQAAARIADAANNFLAALRPDVRKSATFAFDDKERRDWSNVPAAVYPRKGARIADLKDNERIAAHKLLASSLSGDGYLKATSIMRADEILSQMSPPDRAAYFGHGIYYLGVFGRPGADARWGWQFDGHHLALHFAVVNGRVAATPAFVGVEPAEVPSGPYAGLRTLGAETDRGFALINALTPEQRKQAILAAQPPANIFTGPGREDGLKSPAGLPAARLDAGQRSLLRALVDEYLGNLHPDVAASYYERLAADGPERLHFAWMGPLEPGRAVYYRIHGPSLLIEYDNVPRPGTEGPNDPNHIHAIVRSPGRDFGEDLLRAHYQQVAHWR